jgi:hypothetical protein
LEILLCKSQDVPHGLFQGQSINDHSGGFGGHCDNFNYTGMLVAVSKVPGVGITNIQAMIASPGEWNTAELQVFY